MFNFSASITVNHVGRNFHVFGKEKSFVFSADAETQGADQGEADVELLGWEELSEAVSFPLPLPPPPLWEFPKIGVPQNGWFIIEKLIKMDDLGVPLFLETPIFSTFSFFFWVNFP